MEKSSFSKREIPVLILKFPLIDIENPNIVMSALTQQTGCEVHWGGSLRDNQIAVNVEGKSEGEIREICEKLRNRLVQRDIAKITTQT